MSTIGVDPATFQAPAGDAPPAAIRCAEAVVGTFREALGPDVGIALDVAFAFRLGGAIKLARALKPYDLMWLETETFDPDALQVIRQSTATPICHGESLYGTQGYLPYLQRHAQDVIMPDLSWNGITMGKKIADMAEAFHVGVAAHNPLGPVSTAACVQLDACIPNCTIQEYTKEGEVFGRAWIKHVVKEPLTIENGYLLVPDKPGIGVELNEEAVRERSTMYKMRNYDKGAGWFAT